MSRGRGASIAPRFWLGGPLLRLAVLAGLAATTGCSGALPLFHAADTLPKGFVTAGAGVAANIVRGDAATALRSAQETTVVGAALRPEDATSYRRGALVAASYAPGLSPWVGARAGLGYQLEAGLTYTGRAMRIDLRRSFTLTKKITFSAGAGALRAIGRRGDGESRDLSGLDLAGLRGLGVDVPLLVGWSSDSDLVRLYGGVRAGHEVVDGDIGVGPAAGGASDGSTTIPIDGRRTWVNGIAGLAIGFRHVFGIVEMSAGGATASGTVGGESVAATGVSLSPGAALVGRF